VPEIFIKMHMVRKTGTEKPAPENGVDLWRQFLESVSWALYTE